MRPNPLETKAKPIFRAQVLGSAGLLSRKHARREGDAMLGKGALLVAIGGCLWFCPPASALGGRYVFDGGTAAERTQVGAALGASAFDWSLVPGQITIHIARGATSTAAPGEIWLDANLLDAGNFSWGVVQHEYAHEVDFLLLDDRTRAKLLRVLGGTTWCHGD